MYRDQIPLPEQKCLALMTPEEWCDWVRHYKDVFHWTNEYMSELCDISIMTISRIAAKNVGDLKFSTRQRITRAICKELEIEFPCGEVIPENINKTIEAYESEIKRLTELNSFYREHSTHSDEESEKKTAYFKDLISDLKRDNRRYQIINGVLIGIISIVLVVNILAG